MPDSRCHPDINDRWNLVRRAAIPRHLRHLLLVLQHYLGKKDSVWCCRESLAEELDVCVAVISQNMKELESLNVISRVWTGRNGRPTREYSIQFSVLRRCQRSVRNSSGSSVSESSQCNVSSVSESSESPSEIPQGQCEGILRHEQPLNNHRTTKRGRTHKSTFEKPTVEQVADFVRAYCHEKNLPTIEPEDFIDHFESNGWKVGGKSPMRDWQASLRKWIRNQQRWHEEQTIRKPGSSVRAGQSGRPERSSESDIWPEVVRFCVDARVTDPEYPTKLRQRFGDAVADSVLKIKVATIKNAADKRAAGNDFPLKELGDRFRRLLQQYHSEEAANATV